MTERKLDLEEIQGNILGGFNTDFQEIVAFSVAGGDFSSAKEWVASLADQVTTASVVMEGRETMKSDATGRGGTWLFVSIGQRFLSTAAPDVLIQDEAFNGGMSKRAPSVLGDKTDPATWVAGSDSKPVDAFLIIASNNLQAAVDRAEELIVEAHSARLIVAWRETARRLNDQEHFGFRDGLSQPAITGFDSNGEIAAGNFIFGYPKTRGGTPYAPTIDPRGVTDNGSLLVWRRLGQDVQAFREFCQAAATTAATQWPAITKEKLAALLVGRWPSGTPLQEGNDVDPGIDSTKNDFDFSSDPEGRVCPFGAHIRKVNPRAGRKDVVDIPRILRRGIPFGPKYDESDSKADRGLVFIAFQSSIKNQFEFLTQHWMNSPLNPAPGDDLLIGRRMGMRSLTLCGPNGSVAIDGPSQFWIVPTGGAYLFAPSRSGLRKLAEPSAPLGLWKVQQVIYRSMQRIKDAF